ncbi:MAG: EAL domain-containing protein [Thalassotalea sp.]
MVEYIFFLLQKIKNVSLVSLIGLTFIVSQQTLASTFQQSLKFDHFTVANGLSQNSTYSITQDQENFIWIATQDGLNRFDGENFIQYRKNNSDANSIADNFIRKVFVDKQNTLWVGTDNGLSRYNRLSDNFDNYYTSTEDSNTLTDNTIWDIYQDNNGTVLVSTDSGLHKYNAKENHFVRIRFRGLENKITAIKTIYQDANQNYWLGTFENGIYISNSKFNITYSLQEDNPWKIKVDANSILDIKAINDQYWLGTDQGLFIINNDYLLTQQITEPQLSSQVVRSIEHTKEHVLIGTHNGLNVYNIKDKSFRVFNKNKHHSALSDDKLMDIFKDSNQDIWIATYEGINLINQNQFSFTHHLFDYFNSSTLIENIAQTENGKLWFSSDQNNLNSMTENGLIEAIELPIEGTLYDLIAERNSLWFIGQDSNLYHYKSNTEELIKQETWKDKSDFNYTGHLTLLNNDIWFTDNQGNLVKYNDNNQSFERYLPDNDSAIITLTAYKNLIWTISANNEIFSFNPKDKKFTRHAFSYDNQFILSAANQIQRHNDWVWVGSSSQGIAAINLKTQKMDVFNEHNLLTNNYINAIVLNDEGQAWCSTNKGISFIDPVKKTSKNYYIDFALNNNEFIEGAGLRSTNGNYFFGGSNGIHEFSPSDLLTTKTNVAAPILTNLLIANKKVSVGKNNNSDEFKLKENLQLSKEITLTYQQSPFSLEFISPNNKFSERIKYRYRLIGLETKWIDSGENNRRATYTNLSAGNYTFQVEAYDIDNAKNIKSSSLAIQILAPWWLSNGALFFYCIIFLMVIAYFVQQLRYKHQYNVQIKESEERLKLSLWGSGDEMWDWNITEGKIYRSNIWGILEFPQDGERNIGAEQTNIHSADLERVKSALKDHFEDKTDHFEVTYRVKDKNEHWVWVLDRGKIVERNTENQASRMTGTLKDISVIKKAEEKLKLFAKCIESISDAIVIYDRQFVVVDVNKAFQGLTNKTKEQMIGTSMRFNQYSKEFNQAIKKHLLTKSNWNGEILHKRDNGEEYITDLNIDIIRDEHGKVSHFVGVFSDITERKQNEAELLKLANTDILTGLPNRSSFQANQTRLVENKTPHALLVFDLDNFKKINDSMGHELGDILLCKVAKRILTIGRPQDSVYRLGGDEFSLLIENTNDIHVITSIAKDVLRTIAIPLKLRSQEVVLFSSIGIVLYPEDGISSEELLKNADTAMYHAKGLGGNKYQFFNESMNKQAVKRLQIENLIRHGLKEDNFSVFYQPKIDISSGKISGMEALVRFETPNKGIISPGVFIPVSEETGQIVEIGEVVLRKACFATKKWLDTGLFDGRVAVNLSAVQFSQPNLVSLIAQILLQSGLPAKNLELEITEGTVMDSPQKAIDIMLQIRSMGIHLSLDDFGTGYSSLAYLKKFPLNTLKIDKAFIDDIEESDQGRNMVATIVTIAHNLGLDVVAEGVETENQLSFLSGLRCEQMQGFLYSKPLSEKHFSNYLLSHQITDRSTSFNL